jgi:hypothetical protein
VWFEIGTVAGYRDFGQKNKSNNKVQANKNRAISLGCRDRLKYIHKPDGPSRGE